MKSFAKAMGELRELGLDGNAPTVESAPSAMRYQLGDDPERNPMVYADASCFGPNPDCAADLRNLAEMETLAQEGLGYVNMLYTYRSSAKAIIVSGLSAPPQEMYLQTFNVLRPEVAKLVELNAYQVRLLQLLQLNVQLLAISGKTKVVPEALYGGIVKLIDVVVQLDNLKDMKACLQNDFATLKRCFTQVETLIPDADTVREEHKKLQDFLSDRESPKSVILFHLRNKIRLVPDSTVVMIDLFRWILRRLEHDLYVLAEDKWMLVRILPHIMFLVHNPMPEKKKEEKKKEQKKEEKNGDGATPPAPAASPATINNLEYYDIFKSKKFSASSVTSIFRHNPVVPLMGDMHISLIYILERCKPRDPSMLNPWMPSNDESKVARRYSLTEHWVGFRAQYDAFVSKFALLVNRSRTAMGKTGKGNGEGLPSIELAKSLTDACLEGLRLLAQWKGVVISQAAYKHSHPAAQSVLDAADADMNHPGIEYERVVRYNYSQMERHVLVDTISLIKSLAGVLQRAEDVVASVARMHIHLRVQDFVQDKLTELLHKADKKKKGGTVKDKLLEVRALVADWAPSEHASQTNVYKQKSKLRKASTVHLHSLMRTTAPSSTQLTLLRFYLQQLFDDKAEENKGKSIGGLSMGLFNSRTLDKSDLDLLETFHRETYFYPFLLDFSGTIFRASCLSDLWYREFYLEMTKCVQFPISMSLPWILIKDIIENPGSEMLESILYALDIYNDAAHVSLHNLKQQWMYDEIEAEVNLVFDQLVFLLSDHLYTYFKSVSSSRALDKNYRTHLQKARNRARFLEVDKRRYEITTAQRHVQLLGRCVDLNQLLSQHLTRSMRTDIEEAIAKFEAGTEVSGVCELSSVLEVIKGTHSLLGETIMSDCIPPFEELLAHVDDRTTPVAFQGRIATHIAETVIDEVIPAMTFSNSSERFVRPQASGSGVGGGGTGGGGKHVGKNMLYGSQFNKAFELVHRLERGFVGRVHARSIVKLLGVKQLPYLTECVLGAAGRAVDVLGNYSEELFHGLDPSITLPKYQAGSTMCYAMFQEVLRSIIEYPQLRDGVFQAARELGNSLAFLYLINNAVDEARCLTFVQSASYVGMDNDMSVTRERASPPPSSSPLEHAAAALEPQYADMIASAVASTCALHQSMPVKPSPLFHDALAKLRVTVNTKFGGLWGEIPTDVAATSDTLPQLNMAYSGVFHRLWSALQFCWCMPGLTPESQASPLIVKPPVKQSKRRTSSIVTVAGGATAGAGMLLSRDQEDFGDGFAWGGCALILALGQEERFEMLDFSFHMLRMNEFEEAGVGATSKKNKDSKETDAMLHARSFLYAAQQIKIADTAVFGILHKFIDGQQAKRVSTGNGSIGHARSSSMLIFHPPATAESATKSADVRVTIREMEPKSNCRGGEAEEYRESAMPVIVPRVEYVPDSDPTGGFVDAPARPVSPRRRPPPVPQSG